MDSDSVNHVKSLMGHFNFSPFRGIHLRDGFVPQNSFHDTYSVDGGTLGEGGFGKVFSAVRNDNGARVAVKLVYIRPNQRFTQIPNADLMVPTEMYLHAEVSDIQGVITLYDYYERADAYLIVMERVERVQELLKFYLERSRLEESVAKEIFVQVVKIVLQVSAAGVFHRDLKAENILIAPHSLSVTLIDFGCAAKVEESPFVNRYCGSLDYAPPEWFLHSEFGGIEATTWSLGVLLYEMVVGKLPFRNKKGIVANRGLSFPSGTSVDCQNLILDCLRSRPHKRLSLQQILDHVWCLPGSGSGSGFDDDISRRNVTPATSHSTENLNRTNPQNTEHETETVVKLESFLTSSSEISASDSKPKPSQPSRRDESFDMTVRHSHENAPFDIADYESESDSPIMRSSEQLWHLWEAGIPSVDLDSVSTTAAHSQENAINNATLDALLLDEHEEETHSVSMEGAVVSFLAELLRSTRAIDQQPQPTAQQRCTSGFSQNHSPEIQTSPQPQPPFSPHRTRATASRRHLVTPYSRPVIPQHNPSRH